MRLLVALDALVLLVALFNLPSLLDRPALPFTLLPGSGNPVVVAVHSEETALCSGDVLVKWNGTDLPDRETVDFMVAKSRAGQAVTFTVARDNHVVMTRLVLPPLNSWVYVLSVMLIGCSTWVLAVFLLVRKPGDPVALAAHWALMGFSVAIMLAWEGPRPLHPVAVIADIMFFAAYACASSFFLFFSLSFPGNLVRGRIVRLILSFPLPLGVLVPTAWRHHRFVANDSISDFIEFTGWFRTFHITMLCLIILAAVVLAWSYSDSGDTEARRKLKWIFWGGTFGPAPFILFTAIPGLLSPAWSLGEEYTIPFFVLVPAGIGTAIVKNSAFDVELVIRRSSAYTAVVALVFSLCAIVIGSVASVLSYPAYLLAAASALLIALLFEPLRRSVNRFVDKEFFRVQYDFRRAEKTLLDRVKTALDVETLAHTMVEETHRLIPSERIGFFTLSAAGNRLLLITGIGFDFLGDKTVRFEPGGLKSKLTIPVALDGSVEPGVPFEQADRPVFNRWKLAVVFPVLAQDTTPLAFLAVGRKRSGDRFTGEDLDLLSNLVLQAGLAMDRLAIQDRLLQEHLENHRLAELNRLKTDFISYVSHEFRTPITTIKMFSDLLERPEATAAAKRTEYLDTIRGEADRLERMVRTVLDAARIENHALPFRFDSVDLREIAERALEQMQYRLNRQGFTVRQEFPGTPVLVRGDCNYLGQAITNLIDNAIKYSCEEKVLWINVARRGLYGVCRIRDAGRGISPSALPHVFERFYRDPAYGDRVQGAGVGLYLVKHIVDAHRGEIGVVSAPGGGSTFSLSLPLVEFP